MEWKARFLISKREFFGKQGGKVVQKVSLKSLKKSVETFLFSLSSSFLVHKAGHRLVLSSSVILNFKEQLLDFFPMLDKKKIGCNAIFWQLLTKCFAMKNLKFRPLTRDSFINVKSLGSI